MEQKTLSKENLERYSRTIILKDIGIEGQLNFLNSSVFVFGCGGIASGLLPILAAAGIGSIIFCEYDSIELSNIQRQTIYKTKDIGKSKVKLAKQHIKAINPNIKVKIINQKFDDQNYNKILKLAKKCSLIIDTTDNFKTRSLINKLSLDCKVPLFSSSCIENTSHFYLLRGYDNSSACYECIFNNPNDIKTCANSGIMPSVSAISGSVLANFVLEYLATPHKFDHFNKMFILKLKTMVLKTISLQKDQSCKVCGIFK